MGRQGNWKRPDRPTGIVRCLPYFSAETHRDEAMNAAFDRMMAAIRELEAGRRDALYIALAARPTVEVLHCYLLMEKRVVVRANISHYEEGRGRAVRSWDGHALNPKWWAVLSAPVVWPPETFRRRGFQGFRYTDAEQLW